MKNPLISVIIPVYNGQDFIVRCVESVIQQINFDSRDVEILLLNDGSPDDSLTLIEGLQSKYSGIVKAFNQPNMGVAKTRNKGIGIATGTYTMFIDQDDYLDNDYLRTFYDAAEKGSYDIVVGGYKRPDDEGRIIRTVDQPCTEYSVRYRVSAAWAKMHRTEFLQKNNIHFYDNAFGEDIIFTLQQSSLTSKIKGIKYIGYNWFWNTESVSNTQQRSLTNQSKIRVLIEDMIPFSKEPIDAYYLVQTGVYYLLHSGKYADPKEFISLYGHIFKLFTDNAILSPRNKLLIGWPGVAFSTRAAVGVFVILHGLKLVPMFARLYCRGDRTSSGS